MRVLTLEGKTKSMTQSHVSSDERAVTVITYVGDRTTAGPSFVPFDRDYSQYPVDLRLVYKSSSTETCRFANSLRPPTYFFLLCFLALGCHDVFVHPVLS